ncbi:MAG: hypothetical protein IJB91_02885 [Oscillospiraceae bacterium]|nr:hypothetical protein [Oscillospiraceae bacterium]
MKDTFTMKELAAILVRRGKIVLIFAVIFALLLGGWQGFKLLEAAKAPKNSPAQIEDRYEKALKAYQEERAHLERQVADKQKQLDNQIAYNEESLLMKIDPLNKTVTTIHLMISGLDNEELNQMFLTETLAIDYAIGRIQKQYSLYWDRITLQKELTGTPYRGVEEKYIQEVVVFSISSSGGGYMTISVTAETEEISNQVAQTLLHTLLEYQPTVVKNSFDHQISLVSQSTKIEIDEELEKSQNANLEKVKGYQTELAALKESLAALAEPSRDAAITTGMILKGTVKYMVLGAALGLVLSVVWVVLSYLFRNRVELSRHLAQVLTVPMLGAASAQKGLFRPLADKILGERIWKDDAQALAYLSANASAHLPANATIALLTTLPFDQASSEVQPLVDALGNQGFQIRFVEDAGRNSLAVHAIQESDCVILAERCGASRWSAIADIHALAESLDSPVKGFVLI